MTPNPVPCPIKLPVEVEPMEAEGGSGKYTAYQLLDADGRSVCDTLNCDHRITRLEEEYDEDSHRMWDEQSRLNMDAIAKALNTAQPLASQMPTGDVCCVCLGTGDPGTGLPCICGGVGTLQAEAQGLRDALYKSQMPEKLIVNDDGVYLPIERTADGNWAIAKKLDGTPYALVHPSQMRPQSAVQGSDARDAARYRWLRSAASCGYDLDRVMFMETSDGKFWKRYAGMDDAIDAELPAAPQPPQGGGHE